METKELSFEEMQKRIASLEKQIETERFYRTSFEMASVGIVHVSPDGNILQANRQMTEITGYSQHEIIGKLYHQITHPDDIAAEKEMISKALEEKINNFEFEKRYIHKNGGIVWVKLFINIVRKPDHKIDYVVATIINISDRKNVESELHQSETMYRQVFDSAGDAIIVTDKKAKIIDINPAFTEITGITRHEIIGKSSLTLVRKFAKPGDFTKLLNLIKRYISDKEATVSDFNYNDKNLEISTRTPKGKSFGIGIMRDVTERKKATRALEESEANLHSVIESTRDSIWSVDKNFCILTVNSRFKKDFDAIYGCDLKKGVNITEMLPPEERKKWIDRYKKVLKGDQITEQETILMNGEKKYFEIRMNPIREKKKVSGISVISTDITALINHQLHLNDLNQQFSIAADAAGFGIWSYNITSQKLTWDKWMFKLYGINPDDFSGVVDAWRNSVHPDDREPALKALTKAITNQNKFDHEFRIRMSDGSIRFLKGYGVLIKSPDREDVIMIGINYDITTHKENEQLIRESKNRFSALVNNLQTGVIYINTKGEIIEMNPAMLGILGSPSLEESKKINVLDFEPLKKIGYAQNLKKCIDNGESVIGEANYLTIWNKQIIVNYYMVPIIENNKVVGVLSANDDVTEKQKAEEQIIFQSRLLNNINDYITATDLDGKIIYVNQTVKRNFNVEPHKSSIHDYGEDPNAGVTQQMIIDETLKRGSWRCEVVNFTKENKRMILDTRTQLLRDQNGKPYGILGLSSDITLRKKYEKELESKNRELLAQNEEYQAINEELDKSLKQIRETTQKLEIAKERAEAADQLKSAFLANMSHEIRTPMNGILGFADLLKEPDITGDEKQHFIDIIEKSGKRMLNIINDLIDISKIESGQMEVSISETNIREQADYLYTFFKPEAKLKGIEFDCKFPDDGPATFYTDREKVYAVITNLLKNAIKYTPKGSIEFGYEIEHKNGNQILHFFVKDTGIGIPDDRISAIFERFIQADIEDKNALEGAGLGLAISKAYAEMLGGTITVQSTEGKGSSFHFYTPDHSGNAAAEVIEDKTEDITGTKPGRELKILIAEDDDTSRMHLSILLQESAAELITVDAGDKAVEMCRMHPDIDLVMMDIKLPGMQGYAATRKIREFNKDVIIIAQTAYALHGDREKALAAGCNDYIAKPIRKDVLINLLHEYF